MGIIGESGAEARAGSTSTLSTCFHEGKKIKGVENTRRGVGLVLPNALSFLLGKCYFIITVKAKTEV